VEWAISVTPNLMYYKSKEIQNKRVLKLLYSNYLDEASMPPGPQSFLYGVQRDSATMLLLHHETNRKRLYYSTISPSIRNLVMNLFMNTEREVVYGTNKGHYCST